LKINIVTDYPLWFILLCLLLGIGYAALLYYKESRNDFSESLKWIMAIFRASLIAVISFLLLNPLVKTTTRFEEKPVIIFAQDNSVSVITGVDSNFYRNQYLSKVGGLLEKIETSFALDKYTFGEKVEKRNAIDFSDKLTDISELFADITRNYSHQNVGALILATDGIFNRGLNPLYSSEKFDFPVYTIALGDTNLQKDLILSKVNYNRIAYLDNEFPMEVIITANKCVNSNVQFLVLKDDSVLFRKNISINTEHFLEIVSLHLLAKETGLQRYRLKLTNVENEISFANNYQDVFIDILEGKQKILLLSNSPNPDITALKQAIQTNKNYEIKDFISDDFDKILSGYNLVIFHGLPSVKNHVKEILSIIDAEKIPVLYVITHQTSLPLLNNRNAGIVIRGDKIIFNEAQPVIDERFSLFGLSENTIKTTMDFPPLISPYGNSLLQPSANVLFNQKIGSVITDEPLFVFNENFETKTAIICGSGIWKWRMTNFAREGNHNAFNEIINKTIQFLSVKVDRSFFRVYTKNNFIENENIEFDAEVYNESYELINDPEVSITITDSKDRKFPYVFNKTGKSYTLNAGRFPVDNYKYTARVQAGDEILKDNGEFTVSAQNIEKINTVANHNILYNLAISRGGDMVYPDNIDDLAEMIKTREDIKTVVYSQKRFSELLNFPLVLLLIILFLSAEWFMRKRSGAY
jgi:hypothetical protein